MEFIKRTKKYYPYLVLLIIIIRLISGWSFPKEVDSQIYAGSDNPRWIRFWLKQIQPIEENFTPVQVIVVFSDGESSWGYGWGSENEVLVPGSDGVVEVGKFSGSFDSNVTTDNVKIYVAILEYRKQYGDITEDLVSLVLDTVLPKAISESTEEIWKLVVSQSMNQASTELADYVGSAKLLDDFTLVIKRGDAWSVGLPIATITNAAKFRIEYQVSGSDEVLVALPPIVQTATPVFNAPTATPLPEFDPEIQLVSSDLAINSKDEMNVLRIPAGEFTMGLSQEQADFLFSTCSRCSTNIFNFSQPIHEVYLDEYWMYETEVTVEQYKMCLRAGACREPHELGSATIRDYFNNARDQEAPVINVDWDMANEYCNWSGGRLPTEAEWEKAARGTDGRLFPWGDDFPNSNLANYDGARNYDVTYVGKYPAGASPYGLMDMAGNVYEWVSDWYHDSYYKFTPHDNPRGPNNFENQYFAKVVRGGNFSFEAAISSAALHDWYEPQKYANGVGFRCAMDIDQ